jgi:hypothetical protein
VNLRSSIPELDAEIDWNAEKNPEALKVVPAEHDGISGKRNWIHVNFLRISYKTFWLHLKKITSSLVIPRTEPSQTVSGMKPLVNVRKKGSMYIRYPTWLHD